MERMTLFRAKTEKIPIASDITLPELHHAIQHGEIRGINFAPIIAEHRQNPTGGHKDRLPAFIATGEFTGRKSHHRTEKSPFMVFDIDGKDQQWDMHSTLEAMKTHGKYFRIICTSPSENGIKIIAEHREPDHDHKTVFNAIKNDIEKTFNVVIDKSGSDVTRLTYLTHDKNAWMGNNGDAFQMPPEAIEMLKTAKKTANIQRKPSALDIKKLNMLIHAIEARQIDITSSYDDWTMIALAMANHFGENGREAFHNISKYYAGYSRIENDEKYDNALQTHDGAIGFATILDIAKQHDVTYKQAESIQHDDNAFWRITQDHKIQISETRLYAFLKSNGVAMLQNNGTRKLVTIIDNIVTEINSDALKRMVKNFIEKLDVDTWTKETIHNAVSKGASERFNETKWALHFDLIEKPQFMRETKDNGYVFFPKKYAEIKADSIKLIPYSEAHAYVWNEWIIERPFGMTHPEDYQSGDWYSFMKTLCTPHENAPLDVDRFNALRWSIGCLCHNPKTSDSKVLIHFCENNANQETSSNGGTGKTLLSQKAIKQVRKVDKVSWTRASQRGKTQFPMQNISEATQVMHFGDVDKGYLMTNFAEDVFDLITDGLTIEQKHKHPYEIPPEDAPRCVSTGNAVPLVPDESSKRRFFIMEIYSRFNASFRPADMFGRQFFESEWPHREWVYFYASMIECIQYYIANPSRPAYISETLKINQFKTNTHPEWLAFIESEIIEYSKNNPRIDINRKDIDILQRFKPHESSLIRFCLPSHELFDRFRAFLKSNGNGRDASNIKPREIKAWMELTSDAMNDTEPIKWNMHPDDVVPRVWTYSHHKLSEYNGKHVHVLWTHVNKQKTAP